MESSLIKTAYHFFLRQLTPRFPKLASKVVYLRGMKSLPDLENPTLFSEKLMKLKLENYAHNPAVWTCADKFMMRDYALERGVPAEHLPALLGVYRDARDIDFDSLPNRFALKCTHGAGFNVICNDKESLSFSDSILKLNSWLRTPFGLESAEVHYNKVQPMIICEKFIESEIEGQLPVDYKVYCFHGIPRYILGCSERVGNVSKVEMFDLAWKQTGYIKPEFSPSRPIDPPECLDTMLDISKLVSDAFPFVRVDFYVEKGKPILGELTFTPHACVNSNMTPLGQDTLGRLLDF